MGPCRALPSRYILVFGSAKDFETPDDADGDGDYEVTVRVTDGTTPVEASLTLDGDVATGMVGTDYRRDGWLAGLVFSHSEGSGTYALDGDRTLEPTLEMGLRHDGGDAETGVGVELAGGLRHADPVRGISTDFNVRGLVAHEDSGYAEWGASGSVTAIASGRHSASVSKGSAAMLPPVNRPSTAFGCEAPCGGRYDRYARPGCARPRAPSILSPCASAVTLRAATRAARAGTAAIRSASDEPEPARIGKTSGRRRRRGLNRRAAARGRLRTSRSAGPDP